MNNLKKILIYHFVLSLSLSLLISGCYKEKGNSTLSPLIIPNAEGTKISASSRKPAIFVSTDDRQLENENQITALGNDFSIFYSTPNKFGKGLILSSNACEFFNVSGGSNYVEITRINNQGDIIDQEGLSFINESFGFDYNYSISPNGKWIAFKTALGDWGLSYEDATIQEVGLSAIDPQTPQTIKILTDHGGAFMKIPRWSANNQYLAFSDYDNYGISQVFIYDIQSEEKIQVTHFSTQKFIQEIRWSFDSPIMAA